MSKMLVEVHEELSNLIAAVELVEDALCETYPAVAVVSRRGGSLVKEVFQFLEDGTFVRSFSSLAEACKITGIDGGLISRCCNLSEEKYKTAGKNENGVKLRWSYKKENKWIRHPEKGGYLYKKCYEFDKEGNFLKKYDTVREAVVARGLFACRIKTCLESPGEYVLTGDSLWSFKKSQKWEMLFHEGREERLAVQRREVFQYDMETGELVRGYISVKDASVSENVNVHLIHACCRYRENPKNCDQRFISGGGYWWSFTEEKASDLLTWYSNIMEEKERIITKRRKVAANKKKAHLKKNPSAFKKASKRYNDSKGPAIKKSGTVLRKKKVV